VVAERIGTILLSALVAHTAWHWMADRWSDLRQFRIEWPAPDLALAAALMRWLMLLLLLAGAVWLLRLWVRAAEARPAIPGAPHRPPP
jgi:hypothetical protein